MLCYFDKKTDLTSLVATALSEHYLYSIVCIRLHDQMLITLSLILFRLNIFNKCKAVILIYKLYLDFLKIK